ncbi:hypothetical protein RS75_02370 [Rhizobium nepotum 39/7]|uniref:Transposase n=1 Tax=Rhizobium nepotum 39/7 TaxID=1368418 RepID=A0ABR5CX69_9HYPH|nr:hypothetical protein RS75_02370 [Rhizobium nepotum 39/7]
MSIWQKRGRAVAMMCETIEGAFLRFGFKVNDTRIKIGAAGLKLAVVRNAPYSRHPGLEPGSSQPKSLG